MLRWVSLEATVYYAQIWQMGIIYDAFNTSVNTKGLLKYSHGICFQHDDLLYCYSKLIFDETAHFLMKFH